MLGFKKLGFMGLMLGTAMLGSSSTAEASRYDAPPAQFKDIMGETSARNAHAAFSEAGPHAVLLSPHVAICNKADARNTILGNKINFYGQERSIQNVIRCPEAGSGGNDLTLILLDQPINNVSYTSVYGFNGEDMAQIENKWGTSYSRAPIYRSNATERLFPNESRVHMGRVYLSKVTNNKLLVTLPDENPQGAFGNGAVEVHRKAVPVAGDEGSPVYFFQNGLKLLGLVSRTHSVNELNKANQTATYALLAGHKAFIQFQLAYAAAHGGFSRNSPSVVNNNNNINNNNNDVGNGNQLPQQPAVTAAQAEAEMRELVAEGRRLRAEREALERKQAEERRVREAEEARIKAEQEAERRAREIEVARVRAEQEAIRVADLEAEKAEAKRVQKFKDQVEQLSWEMPSEGKWRKMLREASERVLVARKDLIKLELSKENRALRQLPEQYFIDLGKILLDRITKKCELLKQEAETARISKEANAIREEHFKMVANTLQLWREQVAEDRQAEEVRFQAENQQAPKDRLTRPYNANPIAAGSDWIGVNDTNTKIVGFLDNTSAQAFDLACRGANRMVNDRPVLRLNNKITDVEFAKFVANKKYLQTLDLTRCTQLNPNTVLRCMLSMRYLRVLEINRELFVDADVRVIRAVCPWIQNINLVDVPQIGDDLGGGAAVASAASRLDRHTIYAHIQREIEYKLREQERRAQQQELQRFMTQARERNVDVYYLDQRDRLKREQNELEQTLEEMQRPNIDIREWREENARRQQEAARAHNLIQELELLKRIRRQNLDVQLEVYRAAVEARVAEIQRELAQLPARVYNRAYAH